MRPVFRPYERRESRKCKVDMSPAVGTLAVMSFEDWQRSVANDAAPPAGLSAALQALWHDGRNDWEGAHQCAQDDHSREGSWVHAYLHRKEGDLGNAGYWYSRAGRKMPAQSATLASEWAEISRELLGAK